MCVCDIGEVSFEPLRTNTLSFLNHVSSNRGSTIIVGLLPGKADSGFGDVTDSEVNRWFYRNKQELN